MPCLNISTNVSLESVDTSAVLSETTKAVAKIIGKPESYVMVVLKGSIPISFGGTQQAAAYGELVSIGGLNPDVNKKLSAEISTILESKLSVPKSRFFLKFYDSKASHCCFFSAAPYESLVVLGFSLIAVFLFVRPIKHKNMLSVCMLCISNRHGSDFGWNGSTF
ncbi:hypothetical protein C4D60_Mb07t05130 [Musa balbisiana]|uniref:Macrophage migration inhibitory factor family protein n=2 Tax=Musa TaxID=4640 RepID=A0A804JZ30_MUSAM|nr:hypothetical protein C4D60_Mb07t05130 [Musa balbisiana]